MTEQEFENAMDNYELEDEYAEFIMENGNNSDRCIHNGDSLIDAMESEYLLKEFKTSLVK